MNTYIDSTKPEGRTSDMVPGGSGNTRVTRRAFLRTSVAATAGSLTIIPAVAAIQDENPDLVRLGNDLTVAKNEYDAAVEAKAWIVAEWKHRWPLAPDGATWPRSLNNPEVDLAGEPIVRPGEDGPRDLKGLDYLKRYGNPGYFRASTAKMSPVRAARRQKYIDECRQAYALGKAYYAEIECIRSASGIDGANARIAKAKTMIRSAAKAIAEQPASTLDGVIIKARAVIIANRANFGPELPDCLTSWVFPGQELAEALLGVTSKGGAV